MLSHYITLFLALLFMITATLFLYFPPPEYKILKLPSTVHMSVKLSPSPLHCVSVTPRVSTFILSISCNMFGNFPVDTDNPCTFHVPIFKQSLDWRCRAACLLTAVPLGWISMTGVKPIPFAKIWKTLLNFDFYTKQLDNRGRPQELPLHAVSVWDSWTQPLFFCFEESSAWCLWPDSHEISSSCL